MKRLPIFHVSLEKNDMRWKIVMNCPECSGTGKVTHDHPNDPFARDVDCGCNDGRKELFEPFEYYDHIGGVWNDYGEAISIELQDA